MQIKEFEAFNLKDCLQQVRKDLGPEAVILETRKFRKGGLLGWGAREAVCIVAATGITVHQDLPRSNRATAPEQIADMPPPVAAKVVQTPVEPPTPSQVAAVAAARNAYARTGGGVSAAARSETRIVPSPPQNSHAEETVHSSRTSGSAHQSAARGNSPLEDRAPRSKNGAAGLGTSEAARLALLEQTMQEIRDSLSTLQREQREGHDRTVSAVVSAVGPAGAHALDLQEAADQIPLHLQDLQTQLLDSGVSEILVRELMDDVPEMEAWSEEARKPLAAAALRDLIVRRVPSAGPIVLTPGQLKAVALIGPTGVGKTTTIAKLAAHFALVEGKRVALLTVDTYRIAAVEQLKTYSQIIDIPIAVAYNQAEVLPAVAQFADYDLLLIDTAGRSQKNIMQVGELKTLLEAVGCETHLVLSANTKERDMLEAAQRFSAARVDRLIFSKLDETNSYGTLLEVADRACIPLSYLTTGQKVPEDIEVASGAKFASLLLG